MCSAKSHVRFTPNSDRESGFSQKAMSALPPKADMCGALGHVCFVPKADMSSSFPCARNWYSFGAHQPAGRCRSPASRANRCHRQALNNRLVGLFDTAGTINTLGIAPQCCLRIRNKIVRAGDRRFPTTCGKLGSYPCWDTVVGNCSKDWLRPSVS